MAITPTPPPSARPLPPPGPSNIIEISPWPFAPSKRELREHARRAEAVNRNMLERERQSGRDRETHTFEE